MPTPLGHALVGMAIAWSAEAVRRTPIGLGARTTLAAACAGLAVCPDFDLIYPPIHRTVTHSVVAPLIVAVIAAVWSRRANREAPWATAVVCGLAYASHLLLDWLGGDTKKPEGIQLFWPFTERWYISTWDLFRATYLRGFFTAPVLLSNGLAVLGELLFLGPIAFLAWRWRDRELDGRSAGRYSWRRQTMMPEDRQS